jgi:DNA repair protein SbcC/Rad50
LSLKWIETIKESGLTFIRKHTFQETLNVYETLHKWKGTVMGKYLILPVSFEEFSEISESRDRFKGFEDEVISPFYFSLKGDWSWNLYICFVLIESDLSRITADRLSLIQRGKRYGKKIIISEAQLSEKIPMARIPNHIEASAASDPLNDWQERLIPEGLLFCLDAFRQQSINEYLESDIPMSIPIIETYDIDEPLSRPNGRIESLNFGEHFRPHCLANSTELNFSQVNLLEGPNGMGKTSILECIELAYTGTIQRNFLVDRNLTEDWNGRLIIEDNESVFYGVPTEAEKKIRETVYYKHKVAPRGQSQLNRAFHQYNYFSSESVHQFCFNSNNKVDYRTAFARVIFGEQLERLEQCWTRYLEEFEKTSRRLEGERRKLFDDLVISMDEELEDNEVLKERVMTELQNMAIWVKLVLPNYPIPDDSSSLLEIEKWLSHLKKWLHELDLISMSFKNLLLHDIDNGNQLGIEENVLNIDFNNLQNQIVVLQENLEQVPQANLIEENIQQHWGIFELLYSRQNDLQQKLEKIKKYAFLFDQRGSWERRELIDDELTFLQTSSRQLEDIWNLYGYLSDIEPPSMNQPELNAQIIKLKERLNQAQTKLNEVKGYITDFKVRIEKQQSLMSELKMHARKYINEHPNQSHCPLCAHDYQTKELLKDAINTSLQVEDAKLTELLTEEDMRAEEVKLCTLELKKLNKAISVLDKMENARTYLLNRNEIEETKSLSEGSNLQDIQYVLKRIYNRMIEQKRNQEELIRQAESLDQRGITISAIRELKNVLKGELFIEYFNYVKPDETSIGIISFITNNLNQVSESVEAARQEYSAVQVRGKQANQYRQDLAKQLEELLKQEKQLTKRKGYLSEIRHTWILLKDKIQLPDQFSWKEWMQYLNKLFLASEGLEKALEPRILLERKDKEISNIKEQIDYVNVKIKRCETAIQVLSDIGSLKQYGDEFVSSNFKAISQLFVALHSPNEFERLEWTEDNKIVAKRKGSDQLCAIHQMSTGQRTSVILSVFFIMHLVMESAPKFLLMDEPVANMDELNVIGLLDFLRQLTITRGTQLFFTTANPQIATLFRRKFSLLRELFYSFHLRRDIEGPVSIHVQQYLPHQEKAIPQNILIKDKG